MNLGDLSGPLLFFGGPYSNLQATNALKNVADELGIPARNIICTGDVVAYCGQPNETVAALRDWGVHVVMGNCEESIGERLDDCGCGFEPGSACDLLSVTWYQFTHTRIDADHRTWMRALPRRIDFRYADKAVAVVHGSINAINEFVFASRSDTELRKQIAAAESDIVVGGHSGLPFSRRAEDKLWHNPGVIGMPANDGTQRGWYSLWNCQDGVINIEHRALDYDAHAASKAMQNAGLVNGYSDALLSGLWPSEDILPDAERVRRAAPIEPHSLMY
ncbi:MAG: metallophosphoesterase family protein [Pseudomonadota bacterium]